MRTHLLGISLMTAFMIAPSVRAVESTTQPTIIVHTDSEPMASGRFEPTWASLQQYEVPDWFRDAKFGIWAHWGPQCQPEMGDWYGRHMYEEGHADYRFHLQQYGHPSEFGFKDVIHQWKAEHWDPQKLVALYKRAGAQYVFAMANHHDNLDLWNSKYQPWNSVKVGPQKDIIAGWAKAVHDAGLKFGVSVHASHAWNWYDVAQAADKKGDKSGIAYDGNLTKKDGIGKWWEGLDPQELYAQRHPVSARPKNGPEGFQQWDWLNGASTPDQAYCDKFYNRTIDLINTFKPDLIYFDDTALPLWPVSDAGLKIAAHAYNQSAERSDGRVQIVIFGKKLTTDQRKCLIWDIERGQTDKIESPAWQTDTCIGDWHYNRQRFNNHSYKSAKTVIQTLCDIVSKNGNLLLNIPVRGDGTIDEDEVKVLEGITTWMDVNKECIFGTRPAAVFGEGPALDHTVALSNQGFNEGKGLAFTADDIRYTQKGDVIYAIVFGMPTKALHLKAFTKGQALGDTIVKSVTVFGSDEKIDWKQSDDGLSITPGRYGNETATVLRMETTLTKR